MNTVPLVVTAPASEFGSLTQEVDFNDPHLMDRDMSFVPGFSNLRRERDIAVAEAVHHKRDVKDIPELPVNMRWGRNQNKRGEPDSTKLVSHNIKGYRPVTEKDVRPDNPWLTSLPPGAYVAADKTIRKGDTTLLVATKQDAARNAHFKAETTKRRVTGMEHNFASIARADGSLAGSMQAASPSAKKEAMSPITGPAAPGTK